MKMNRFRKRVFEIVERSSGSDTASTIYDIAMVVIIAISLIPLAFKTEPMVLVVIDKTAAAIFIVDYLLRWLTADYRMGKGAWSFVLYPFTLMALIDLASILPSVTALNQSFKLLRLLRMFRAMRVMRIFKALRYSKNFEIIIAVLKKSKQSLGAVCALAFGYIIIAALVIFNVEPDTFNSFFDAVYWATVSLTTVGYGDIYPVSTIGQVFTMISSFLGIAIVALPAGIITAGYMDTISKDEKDDDL